MFRKRDIRIAVFDPELNSIGHSIDFNKHVINLLSQSFKEVCFFGLKEINDSFYRLPSNVTMISVPLSSDNFSLKTDYYHYIWRFIDKHGCDLLLLSSEEHDNYLFDVPPPMPFCIIIHVVWSIMTKTNRKHGKSEQANRFLKKAKCIFVLEDYLIPPMLAISNEVYRFPHYVYDDDYKIEAKNEGEKLKLGTIGVINARRNVDFILKTLMQYNGNPIEYNLHGKPLREDGEKVQRILETGHFGPNVKINAKFSYLTNSEYDSIVRECDFIILAYDESRRYQASGSLYRFTKCCTPLIVPKIEPFLSIGNSYDGLFLFYDNLSSTSLNNLLSILSRKDEMYISAKEKALSASRKFIRDNSFSRQIQDLKATIDKIFEPKSERAEIMTEKSGRNHLNVVLNFHRKDQKSAGFLIDLLLLVDEGMDCTYYLQYGDTEESLLIKDKVLKFLSRKNAFFSNDLPDIKIPQEMIDDDPNSSKKYEGNHTVRPKSYKLSILGWNLCLYKYINKLDDPFLIIEPDCVVFKNNWLKDIYEGYKEVDTPIKGHIKTGKIRNQQIPTHWAGCSLYDPVELRKLPLNKYFFERYDNPWWPYRNDENTVTANNCFWGPKFSGYDISYDYFLFALYWREKTGINDPMQWPIRPDPNSSKYIFCDFKTKYSDAELFNKYTNKLPLFHGAKDDAIRIRMIRYFGLNGIAYDPNIRLGRPESDTHFDDDNRQYFDLGDYKDKFKNERCFIIGNGPSLNKTNLKLLRYEYSIGLNRIYLNYENMNFEPTFYCCINPNVIQQFSEEIDRVKSIKFLRKDCENLMKVKWNTFFVDSLSGIGFNEDLATLGWYEGWTVTYAAMQLAFYLGFKTVILIGVDHYYKESGSPNKLVTNKDEDCNHFHPSYFGKGVKWQYPDLERSEQSYITAKEVYERNNRRILDATIDGKLRIFDRVAYHLLFDRDFKQPSTNKKIMISKIEEPNIPGWFSIKELGFLHGCILFQKPRNCIEIGPYMGRSTYAICSALRLLGEKRRVLCVDTFSSPVSKDYYEKDFMVRMMNKYPDVKDEYSNYKRYPNILDCFNLTMTRHSFMEELVEIKVSNSKHIDLTNESFEFALIDGGKRYRDVRLDFLKLTSRLIIGGLICIHGYSPNNPGLKTFVDEIRVDPALRHMGTVGTLICFQLKDKIDLGQFTEKTDTTPLPIIVYQMGKVGSTSVVESLRTNNIPLVYQVHRLNIENIREHKRNLERKNIVPPKMDQLGEKLYDEYFRTNKKVKLISIVREPISRNISAFFQNLNVFSGEENVQSSDAVDQLIKEFLENYSHDVPLTWFDSEMMTVSNIDVYEHEFDKESGYAVIDKGNVELLLYKLEIDDRVKEKIISDFLNIADFKLSNSNIGKRKDYSENYSAFLDKIKLPRPYIDKMLDSKYTKHFYTDNEIERIRNRWTRNDA